MTNLNEILDWVQLPAEDVLQSLIFTPVDDDARVVFTREFCTWQAVLKQLTPLNIAEIGELLHTCDLDDLVPELETYDENILASAYFRQTRLMGQVTRHIYEVSVYASILADAHKRMKETARLMFKGTDKDKDAQAAGLVRYVGISHSCSSALLSQLEEIKKFLQYCQKQMESLHWDRSHLLKRNMSMLERGGSSAFATAHDSPSAGGYYWTGGRPEAEDEDAAELGSYGRTSL